MSAQLPTSRDTSSSSENESPAADTATTCHGENTPNVKKGHWYPLRKARRVLRMRRLTTLVSSTTTLDRAGDSQFLSNVNGLQSMQARLDKIQNSIDSLKVKIDHMRLAERTETVNPAVFHGDRSSSPLRTSDELVSVPSTIDDSLLSPSECDLN